MVNVMRKSAWTIFADDCTIYNFRPRRFYHKTNRFAGKIRKTHFREPRTKLFALVGSTGTFRDFVTTVSLTSTRIFSFPGNLREGTTHSFTVKLTGRRWLFGRYCRRFPYAFSFLFVNPPKRPSSVIIRPPPGPRVSLKRTRRNPLRATATQGLAGSASFLLENPTAVDWVVGLPGGQ